MRAVAAAVVVAAVIVGVVSRPVCEPIDEEEVRTMQPPIEARRRERTLWFKTYVVREQRWCRCRPWVEQALSL